MPGFFFAPFWRRKGSMMSRSNEKQAVMIGTLPEGFKPQRPWDIPPAIDSCEVFAKNLTMTQALGFIRVFNKRQIETGLTDRKWAMAIRHGKPWSTGRRRDVDDDSALADLDAALTAEREGGAL